MGLLDYLTTDKDQQSALMQGLLAGAFGAMAGRGTPLQAWGQGGLMGLQGYTGARDAQSQAKRTGLQDQMLQAQLEAQKRQAEQQAAQQAAIRGSIVQPQMPATMDARDIGQPGEAPLVPQFDMQRYAMNLAQMGSPEALPAFQALQPKPADYKVVGNNLVRIGPGGVSEAYRAPAAPDKGTTDIQEFHFAVERGEVPAGMSFTEWLRGNKRAGATNVSFSADKGFAGAFGKNIADTLQTNLDKGAAAEASNSTVASIREAMESGKVIPGPWAQLRQGGLRIGQVLGAGSQDSADALGKTREVQQGLAQIELDAAQLMKGQGQITEAERGIIRRAAAGEIQDMTESELSVVLAAIERNNNRAISRATSQARTIKENPVIGSLGGLIQAPSEPEKVRRYNPKTGKIE